MDSLPQLIKEFGFGIAFAIAFILAFWTLLKFTLQQLTKDRASWDETTKKFANIMENHITHNSMILTDLVSVTNRILGTMDKIDEKIVDEKDIVKTAMGHQREEHIVIQKTLDNIQSDIECIKRNGRS